jgi:Iap family predicted aminopeptidase
MNRLVRLAFVACALQAMFMAAPVRPAPLQKDTAISTAEEIQEEFKQVPCAKKERLAAVRMLFERMGAVDITTQKFRDAENLIVKHGAPSLETIVIGAHYDFVDAGCGAIDNWSGVVALAHVYRTIREFVTNKNVLFVAFDNEEKGLVGSRAMANAIPKEEIPQYCTMINIDSFGLAGPFVLSNTSSAPLIKLSEEVAADLQLPFYKMSLAVADADSSSFLAKKIPAITLSGLSNDWQSVIHTSNDQAAKVNSTSVYHGYRLALSLWSRVDAAPCDTFRKP